MYDELLDELKKRKKKKIHSFKKFRRDYAITQMELARQLGCSQTFISYVEKRYKRATAKMLKKFKAFKKKIEDEL